MKKKTNLKLYLRSAFVNCYHRFFVAPKWGYKIKSKYKIKKDESVLIISNHQTIEDVQFISLSFNKPIHAVISDTFFSQKNRKLFRRLGYIPHRKGLPDYNSTIEMARIINHGGSILLFPEGNRTYAEFQYHVDMNLIKMVKALKPTIVLFNLVGGTGKNPRWGKSVRKGPFYGEIKKILKYEEYADIAEDKLFHLIMQNIRVFDGEFGYKYRSDSRAEYLEEMLFACPVCHNLNSLYSKDNYIHCRKCGLEVEYQEDLTLRSPNNDFPFHILNDWYQYQKQAIKDYEIKENQIIFTDENLILKELILDQDEILIDQGTLTLDDKELTIGHTAIPLIDIICVSPYA